VGLAAGKNGAEPPLVGRHVFGLLASRAIDVKQVKPVFVFAGAQRKKSWRPSGRFDDRDHRKGSLRGGGGERAARIFHHASSYRTHIKEEVAYPTKRHRDFRRCYIVGLVLEWIESERRSSWDGKKEKKKKKRIKRLRAGCLTTAIEIKAGGVYSMGPSKNNNLRLQDERGISALRPGGRRGHRKESLPLKAAPSRAMVGASPAIRSVGGMARLSDTGR